MLSNTLVLIAILAITLGLVFVFYKFLVKKNVKDVKDVIKDKSNSNKDASSFR